MFWRRWGCKETGWHHGFLPLWTVWKTKENHTCLQAMQLCTVGMNSRIYSWRCSSSSRLKDIYCLAALCFPRYIFTLKCISPSLFQPCWSYHRSLGFSTYLSFLYFYLVLPFKSCLRCSVSFLFSGIDPIPGPSAALGWPPLLSFPWVNAFLLVVPLNLGGTERTYRNSFGVIQI